LTVALGVVGHEVDFLRICRNNESGGKVDEEYDREVSVRDSAEDIIQPSLYVTLFMCEAMDYNCKHS
jgi:hypothetical protein